MAVDRAGNRDEDIEGDSGMFNEMQWRMNFCINNCGN